MAEEQNSFPFASEATRQMGGHGLRFPSKKFLMFLFIQSKWQKNKTVFLLQARPPDRWGDTAYVFQAKNGRSNEEHRCEQHIFTEICCRTFKKGFGPRKFSWTHSQDCCKVEILLYRSQLDWANLLYISYYHSPLTFTISYAVKKNLKKQKVNL